LMADGAGYPLDDWLDEPAYGEDRPFRDIFVPGTLEQNVADDGHTYMIPYGLVTVAFWYDKRNFEDAGIEKPPETWEEFLEVCA
jgi:ABC-type glycerol-3-phosphate transport system substrate-binding protein